MCYPHFSYSKEEMKRSCEGEGSIQAGRTEAISGHWQAAGFP